MEALCLRWVNGWRWLKKPKVQRLVCLASSVVGLICYALSSTFNLLLGNWIWWKMLLYIVFSFIICLGVLFSPARSSSTPLQLEAHLAFFVLIVTSVYSFLFDNIVKGKPDAYSLISCAAFATMSLGFSNLTQLGFPIDLLYFFCGSLTVQLMKIKLWLVIVGGGFSYSLLQIRYYTSKREGDDPGRESSGSHVINMPQEGGIDSTLVTPPEDISHPQDDGKVPPSEITRHPSKNAMKLNPERVDSESRGKAWSTGRFHKRENLVQTGRFHERETSFTRADPERADLRRITSAKFRHEPSANPTSGGKKLLPDGPPKYKRF